ncbi:MAG TPA: PSD1 and planctomycete cytochrome C domain-containing protein [Bryobacteraceae bacterium]|nr:PSD1 and planctomycete cytochrome C domain-containing protein [Bryobacteraceae bacterium]
MLFPVFLLSLAALAAPVDYGSQVAPLLRAKCYGCHGAAQQLSGLRLDQKQAAFQGGYSGPSIIAGKAGESSLIARVIGIKGLIAMPPGSKELPPEEIAILKAWIDEGAVWPEPAAAAVVQQRRKSAHWAFQPIARHSGSVDAFVHARLAKEKIQPAAEADPLTLLRRVHLDLTGLPPTPEEIRAFLADRRPHAYEAVVDRLLSSPHFGERWARPWLDRARYADSDGYEKDWVRPYAWRYRQWVIDALNQDMAFGRFTVEQLAGDLLPGATAAQRVPTGFLRMTLTNREGGVDNNQFKFENTVDRVNTMGATWLGLTVGCTQCHDHKFDPISQRDYYQLFAFFDHVEESDIDAPMPGEMAPYLAKKDEYTAKREALLKEYKVAEQQTVWEKEMLRAGEKPGERTDWDLAWDCLLKLTESGDGEKIMRIPPGRRTPRERDVLVDHFIRNYHFAVGPKAYAETRFKELDEKLKKLKEEYPQLTQAMTVAQEQSPKPSYLRVRGDYRSPGIEVQPQAPSVLPALNASNPTRLDLARWIVARENPLTSRVTVNWIWSELFGRGIVRSLDDFGTRADKPSHPELLDYLAAQFMDNGWSMKKLIREVVVSSTYRQSSKARPELLERDPDNSLLGRQQRLRLPAELVRDAALTAGGLISLDVGGRSIRPPQPDGVMELGYGNRWGNAWPVSKGSDQYRRGLYIHFQRSTPYPMLVNFDAPKANVAQCRRDRSNTPLQALNLLNDPVFQEAAAGLAKQATAASDDFNARLEHAFLLALNRPPSSTEKLKFESWFAKQKESDAWAALASVLLNLDEFLTRE